MVLPVVLLFGASLAMAEDNDVRDEIVMQDEDIDQTRAELDRMQREYEEKTNPGETEEDDTPDVMLPEPNEWED